MTSLDDPTLTVYGAPWCPHCKRVKRFLAAHRVPYRNVDIDEHPEAIDRIKELQNGGQIIPTVVYGDGTHEVNPSNDALARRIGLTLEAERAAYDLVIVGGGPAGLSAAIYAAREGIDAIVVDASALGGQAGISDRIDNYPGFPEGISGAELAERFVAQAKRYHVELLSAVAVTGVEHDGEDLVTTLSSGQVLTSHAVIVATGSTYRRLDVPGEEDLIGAGVHFCATCDGPFYKGAEEVVVIGGGNSALEEGLHLSEFAKHVRVLAHSDLTASSFLQERVRSDPQFVIQTGVDIVELRRRAGPIRGRGGPGPQQRRGHPVSGGGRFRLYRTSAERRVPRPRRGARRRRLFADQRHDGDDHGRRLRGRRRSLGVDQAARLGGGRWDRRPAHDPPLPPGARPQGGGAGRRLIAPDACSASSRSTTGGRPLDDVTVTPRMGGPRVWPRSNFAIRKPVPRW